MILKNHKGVHINKVWIVIFKKYFIFRLFIIYIYSINNNRYLAKLQEVASDKNVYAIFDDGGLFIIEILVN